ncbi:5-(carboxyamino)imidazole ribonucleotide synthase [Sphingomonas sp. HDW15A]|uniref:5-(carboxyamino)imidazole ribonucleotide synthase n=1 Tax=Sphingomonas sp. HDW15A TaxID=2714942 RepID=UPI00140CC5D4|nr:5-(carboxyamino)imidazole ribonucleotide synthase [Sphingomonas sp. HDW15A]QIK97260.1 5-(carboxyamino)imidazole ribonucleotide synthase [Sphingomonas sp. HDW15A]
MLPPGSTVGIVGGGQLGRMMAIAAARLGYRCHIYDPHDAPCAVAVSGSFTRGEFTDQQRIAEFAALCDVVTYEFENVPVGPLAALGAKLLPGTRSLEVAQDRALEKEFLESTGARVAPWRRVESVADAGAAEEEIGLPLVLKTRRFGYDGKGQSWARSQGGARQAYEAIGRQPAVAESGIAFEAEFSVIVARGQDGAVRSFDPPRNIHDGGILRRSIVPGGPLVAGQAEEAKRIAGAIVAALGHVGVLTVEFFATADGPLVNEFAPRVHNSGHWTIEGAKTSQFEQHIRAICGLPLGDPGLVDGSVEMENLIGADVERWPELIAEQGAAVHLYDKGEVRPGRKMGHVTRVGAGAAFTDR